MKFPSLFVALSCMLIESDGFSLTHHHHQRALTTSISLKQEDAEIKSSQPHQYLCVAALASALSFGALPTPCYAATAPGMAALSAPTMVLSEQIKTLDMSLPSYNDVADAKASVETVKSLAAEDPPARSSASEGGRSERKSSSGAVSEKAAKKKEEALAKQKAREAFERENIKGKAVDVVDMSVPNYDQSTTQSQRSSFSL